MSAKRRKLSKKIIFLIVAGAIISVIALTCIGLQIAFVVADNNIECWRPDYEQQNIYPILSKEQLSDEDYETLYAQTGLTKIGVDRMKKRGSVGISRILAIQREYFTEHEVINNFYAPFLCTDKIDGTSTFTYLENGDIIVSSSTHLSGWRMGHAGLVTDADEGKILQANAVTEKSKLGTIRDFNDRVNFLVLSPKADTALKAEVCKYAEENLTGKTYDPTAGVFSSKNKADRTQCAHLVWHAYDKFGLDLDSDGGLVVTPKDIAGSPFVELVQVFGFDPDKLWK